jgi:hypothetical protein
MSAEIAGYACHRRDVNNATRCSVFVNRRAER